MAIRPEDLGGNLEGEIRQRLLGAGLDQLVVAQAKRRMRNKGDSEHRYPDLWNPDFPARRAFGDQPLRDKGIGMNLLNATVAIEGKTLEITLRDGTPNDHLVPHQDGFTTKGPNFIPLTEKALVTHVPGNNPKDEGLRSVAEWRAEGEQGKDPDYSMAWKGVTVPQRKVFNTPPEDEEEIMDAIQVALERN